MITCLEYTKTIPIIFGAVSDPYKASLLSRSDTNLNISGITDMLNYMTLLRFIKTVLPKAKKIGIISLKMINDELSISLLKKAINELNYSILEHSIYNCDEIINVSHILAQKSDLILLTPNFYFKEELKEILLVCKKYNVPLFGGSRECVENGSISTIYIDYKLLGRELGQMVKMILNGKEINKLHIRNCNSTILIINQESMTSFNLYYSGDNKYDSTLILLNKKL